MNPFSGSYLASDVEFLLKPIALEYTSVAEKEARIQSGQQHYSEMLSVEYQPSAAYLTVFHAALAANRRRLAQDVLRLAQYLAQRPNPVLVSLARAGTPVGVLLKRTLAQVYQQTVAHYSISIIRDRGIDTQALQTLLRRHDPLGRDLVFIDGWTGKGVIAAELAHWVTLFNQQHHTQISPDLAVLADICGAATIAATREDYLIPSALLNSTISGLISRSILNAAYIDVEAGDYHGCRYYQELAGVDLSLWYIEQIMAEVMMLAAAAENRPLPPLVLDEAARQHQGQLHQQFIHGLLRQYQIGHINLLKPGLGEAIRVLLRRLPKAIVLQDDTLPSVQPLLLLAQERQVPVWIRPDMPYQALGIIANVR